MLGSRAGYVGVPRNKRMPEDLVALRGGSSIDKQRGLWSRGIIKGFVILLALLGLIVVGRLALSTNSASKVMGSEEETLRQSLFIHDDLKSGHLSADRLKGLIGVYYAHKPPSLNEMKALLQKKEKVITRDQLPGKTRVIPSGGMVTMDYVEDRLNVHLDDTSHIKKAKYG